MEGRIEMKARELRIAEKFKIVSECQKLEKELLQIDNVIEVDFDLDGFYDNMDQVIILIKYDIPVSESNYFQKKRDLVMNVVKVAKANNLELTEDRIEDYGGYFYFVFHCIKEWNK